MMKKFFATILIMMGLFPMQMQAQCDVENQAFQAGESVRYDLYFDWGIIWKKVGYATFTTEKTTYKGQSAYDIRLMAVGSKESDMLFKLRDSLQVYMTERLEPLYYKKAAEEGSHYSVDEAWYSREGGVSKVHQLRTRPGVADFTPVESDTEDSRCIYDMLSIIARARNFSDEHFVEGHQTTLPLATGRKVEDETLICLGNSTIKAKDGKKYACKGFSLFAYDKDGDKNELLRFYITDDANRLPIRIDFYLKIGSAKAYLKEVKGNAHPLTSANK